MIILIDAYNVLKQVISPDELSESERVQFINKLDKYAKKKGHKIIVVFDGGPYGEPSKERKGSVYIIYVGSDETADDYIKRYMKKNKALDILLVSSDNEVCRAASRLGIEILGSTEFYMLMKQGLKHYNNKQDVRHTKAIKTAAEKNEELDALMQEASKHIEYKGQDFVAGGKSKQSRAHQLSKKDRKKLKKIKKL